MKRAAIGLALAALTACGKPAGTSTLPVGFRLTTTTVALPDAGAEAFPAGPGAAAMDANCRACHSPSMVLVQPPLKHDDWLKEVNKMRSTYKAPVAEPDVPAILGYLDALSAQQAEAR